MLTEQRTTLTNDRVKIVFEELIDSLRQLIIKHRITDAEYRALVEFADEVGRSGEIPLFADVFLGVTFDNVTYEHYAQMGGTSSNILGPYYLEGTPVLSPPYRIGRRDNEPGDVLFFSGRVLDAKTGAPLADAWFDVWQTAANGLYDHQDPDQPPFNMRGKFSTDEEGRFEFRTVVPAPYEIPKAGPTGRLLTRLGRHAWRPKHIHLKVSREGYLPLTTQVYFEGDRWLHEDCVEAVKPELVARLEKHESREEIESRGLDRPFYTTRFEFRLVPSGS